MTAPRKLLTLVAALLVFLSLAGGAAAAWSPPLHRGVSGPRVRAAKWLMQGNNKLYPGRLKTYRAGSRSRYFGLGAAKSTRRTKYLLGFPIQSLNGTFGWRIYGLLTGQRKLSPLSLQRRKRRLALLRRPHLGVVAQGDHCRGYYAPYSYVLSFARVVSARYGRPLVCISGYRPGSIVSGSGRLSMHATRQAADLATPTYAMNTAVGRSALVAAGMSRARASTYYSFAGWYGGANILFHTYIGGNHYNHVHVGVRSWPVRSFASFAAPDLRSQTRSADQSYGAWRVFYHRGLAGAAGTSLGYAIVAVKRELVFNGFTRGVDTATRYFGAGAEAATMRFQTAHGLKADGVVGPHTALLLLRKRAEQAADNRGIPDHLLARQKTWESANDPNAIGPDGNDHGLVQIRLTSHPDVSLAEAVDPGFSLPWAADREHSNYLNLRDWDAVLCAWNAGYSLAAKWLAAGKPDRGGPVNANGVDLYYACSNYVSHVRASAW